MIKIRSSYFPEVGASQALNNRGPDLLCVCVTDRERGTHTHFAMKYKIK